MAVAVSNTGRAASCTLNTKTEIRMLPKCYVSCINKAEIMDKDKEKAFRGKLF